MSIQEIMRTALYRSGDADKSQWISKEDTGTESFTEKEKGLASDSFKRACFNWGIGRELYTAPDMWVSSKDLKPLNRMIPHISGVAKIRSRLHALSMTVRGFVLYRLRT